MLLSQKPTDYGIDRYIWTGEIIITVLKQRWGVELKDSRIYEILDSLNLSHQKAHRDYANADQELQLQFVETIKKKLQSKQEKEKIAFFDEFAVYDRPRGKACKMGQALTQLLTRKNNRLPNEACPILSSPIVTQLVLCLGRKE